MVPVNKNETRLFILNLIISLIIWITLIAITFGIILIFLFLFWLASLLVRSLFITHVKGDGVKVTAQQFPDLYETLTFCCEKLVIEKIPHAYIINGNGILNAFATRFLRTNYLILNSDIVDALEHNPKAIRFYVGHELGHIKRKHVLKHFLLFPAIIFPLLGPAYLRACEYSCDLHGLTCGCSLPEAHAALSVLASGQKRWQTMNVNAFIEQSQQSGKFWMAFNELTRSHPWLSKRCAYLTAITNNQKPKFPRRNFLAHLLALCIPNFTRHTLVNLLVAVYIAILVLVVINGNKTQQTMKMRLDQQNTYLMPTNNLLNNR